MGDIRKNPQAIHLTQPFDSKLSKASLNGLETASGKQIVVMVGKLQNSQTVLVKLVYASEIVANWFTRLKLQKCCTLRLRADLGPFPREEDLFTVAYALRRFGESYFVFWKCAQVARNTSGVLDFYDL